MKLVVILFSIFISLIIGWTYYIRSGIAGVEEEKAGVHLVEELHSAMKADPVAYGKFDEIRYEASRNRVYLNVHGWDSQQGITPVLTECRRLLESYDFPHGTLELTMTFCNKNDKTCIQGNCRG